MKNAFKVIFSSTLVGVGTYIGYSVARKCSDVLSDPVKRANLKKGMKTVKNAFSKKAGS